jgi:hypothetical protein
MADAMEDHHDAAGEERGGRVERVAAEDRRNALQHHIANRAPAGRRDRPEQHRGEPAEADREGLVRAGCRPAPERECVHPRKDAIPAPSPDRDDERDHHAAERGEDVRVVRERDRRAVLQQRVPDQAAAEAGQDREHAESDRVEPKAARDDAAEDGIPEDADQVDRANDVVHLGDRSRHKDSFDGTRSLGIALSSLRLDRRRPWPDVGGLLGGRSAPPDIADGSGWSAYGGACAVATSASCPSKLQAAGPEQGVCALLDRTSALSASMRTTRRSLLLWMPSACSAALWMDRGWASAAGETAPHGLQSHR